MTAAEIREWSEKLESATPARLQIAHVRILYEIAAQLAELRERFDQPIGYTAKQAPIVPEKAVRR